VVQNPQCHTSQVNLPPTNPPMGNAKSHNVRDIWTFYKKVNNLTTESNTGESTTLHCVFCWCITHFFKEFLSYFTPRALAIKQCQHVVAMFSPTSSTSTLQNHFILKHDVVWVHACDWLKIPIKIEADLECVARVQGTIPGECCSKEVATQPFTKVTFIETIIEFIVRDDLVCNAICLYFPVLKHLSQLMSLSHHGLLHSSRCSNLILRTRTFLAIQHYINGLKNHSRAT
jgi:hypothetical protein